MNILLLKPIGTAYYVIQPNLGLGYLAKIMIDKGHNVKILDSGKENLKWSRFAEIIKAKKFDIIGIQMFTHEILSVKKHIDIIKKNSPETTILVGGAHISGDPKGTMQLLEELDFGFVGEAEKGIEKFISLKKSDYSNSGLLRKIPNLVWRSKKGVEVNRKENYKELDEIKFPAWDLMKPFDYPTAPHGSFCKKTPVAPLIISRGCPFLCAFCAGNCVTGRILRYRSVENVLNEIKMLYNQYGVREFHIEDDNFTLKKEFVIKFCKAVVNLNLDIVFALPNGIRLDTLDEEVLVLMEKAGFYSAAVGIESGSDRILKIMRKNLSKNKIKEKIDLIKKVTKMSIVGFFLVGYPGETKKEILESINFAKSLKIDKASFSFVMPLPGTELWEVYKEKNQNKDIEWNNFFYYKIIKGVSDIQIDDLRRLQRKAIISFYMRPKILFGLLKEIKKFSQMKIIAKRAINIVAFEKKEQ